MRICVVTHYCKPHIGGIETISFQQAQQLVQRDHQVTIVSSKTRNESFEENIQGLRIRRVKAFNFLEQRLGVPYPIFYPSLFQVLDQEIKKADICIVHSFGFLSSLVAAWLCRKNHTPYIVIQNNQFIPYKNLFLNIVQYINDLVAGQFIVHNATEVLAVSQCTQSYIKSLVNREVEILTNGVDHWQFSPSQYQQNERILLGLPTNKFLVLAAGRLVFGRSLGTCLAAANLLKEDPRIIFVIVGDGPDRLSFEKYLRNHKLKNCVLVGPIHHHRMPEYYRAADMFVLPSRAGEGMPIAILEAWASGLPVIATTVGGQVDFIENNHNGFLIDPCAPDQIAKLVSFYVDKPDMLKQIGKQGYETVIRYFTLDAHIKKLLLVLERNTKNQECCRVIE